MKYVENEIHGNAARKVHTKIKFEGQIVNSESECKVESAKKRKNETKKKKKI